MQEAQEPYSLLVQIVSFNEAGVEQNAVEASPALQSRFGEILAKVYDRSSDNQWIVSEKVRPIKSEEEFADALGIHFTSRLYKYVTLMMDVMNSPEEFSRYAKEDIRKALSKSKGTYLQDMKKLRKDPWVQELINLIVEFDLGSADISADRGNVGIAPDGRPVIIDYGFTRGIGREYYVGNRRPHKRDFEEKTGISREELYSKFQGEQK